jgi:tRNA (guanine-N7-)-methyltransferase
MIDNAPMIHTPSTEPHPRDAEHSQPGAHPPQQRRAIRSFVLRAGRMTDAQRRALEQHWPRYGIEVSDAPLNFAAIFGRSAPCTLEIGFGNGEHLAMLAAAHPERDFIGIEVHPPGVGHLLHLAAENNLTNLRVLRHDAVEVLERQIAAESLDEILVLFPDPWHKKRHHKRRLIDASFAYLAASRLRPGGTLRLATDWTPYAEQMLKVLSTEPLLMNLAPDGRYMPRDAARQPTRFERRGERLGHEVHDLAFVRTAPAQIRPDSGDPAPR